MRRFSKALLAGVVAVVALSTSSVFANHTAGSERQVGGMEIDGDFLFPSGPALPGEQFDWDTVGNVTRVDDLANSQSDDIFGNGSKEQEPNDWKFTTGKPPGKDDLTRAYFASKAQPGNSFLWLAFERLDIQGSGDAHIDFEINQKNTTIINGAGTQIPERTPKDLLVVYDYAGGTGPVTIQVFEWSGSALFGSWIPANPPPNQAWGDINRTTINRPDLGPPGPNPGDPFGGGTVGARRFGEVGLDIDGIFGPNFLACPGFSTFWAKSRSSGQSFNSALKDMTPRATVDFSSCGDITVLKRDDANAPLNGATFKVFKDTNANGSFDEGIDGFVQQCLTGEEGVAGRCTFEQLAPATYFVKETAAPDGYTLDPTVSKVVLGFREHKTVSHVYVNPKVRYRITMTPANDSNLVDTNHQINMLLEKSTNGGGTWSAASGETVAFSLNGAGTITSITPSGPTPTSCTTPANGTCAVVIHSASPGQTTLTATFQKQTATTPVTANGSASKSWVNYRLTMTPASDTNLVSTNHTFTVTVEKTVNGTTWTPVAGAAPSVSITGGPGGITSNGCASPGTNGSGQCTVVITSATPGTTTVKASYLAQEGDTSRTFEVTATKNWVDYRISVAPDATNPVGTTHQFTVTLERTTDGTTFSPVVGAKPSIGKSGVGSHTENCSTTGTDANGRCFVTVTSATAGTTTITASYLAQESDTSRTFSATGTKRWEDFRLGVTPGSAVNKVGDAHTFTVLLERNTGTGFTGYPGQTVNLTLTQGTTDAVFTSINGAPASGTVGSCVTTSAGTCTVVINSSQPGTATLSASWSNTVGGHPVSKQASGAKTYVSISLDKSACPLREAPPGGAITYDLALETAGATLTGVVVTDTLPAGVTLVDASALNGIDPSAAAGVITWNLGTLPPTTSPLTATVRVIVDPAAADGTVLHNRVIFDANEIDPGTACSDPDVACHDVTVAAGTVDADGSAYGVRVDVLGGGLLIGDPDVAPTPVSEPGTVKSLIDVPDPFGSATPLASLLRVQESDLSTSSTSAYQAMATASDVVIGVPDVVTVTATTVRARSTSIASGTSAGSSSAGSTVQDLVINGVSHGDIDQAASFTVKDLAGNVVAEVHVLEEIPTGAAAGQPQPGQPGASNGHFRSGLAVNGIRVELFDLGSGLVDTSSEIVVSNAETSAVRPATIGCITTPAVGAEAYALGLFGLQPDAGSLFVDHVVLPITGGAASDDVAIDVPGVGTSRAASTSVAGEIGTASADANARSTITDLDLLAGTITAKLIEATAAADLGGAAGTTTIAGLSILGFDVCAELGLEPTCTPEPNRVLVLDGGNVIVMLNEQMPTANGIAVNAVHIWVLGDGDPFGLGAGAEIVISHASASATPGT